MNRRLYALHRWLSLAVVLQLLAWSVSGLFFAVVPKDELMGSPVKGAHEHPLDAAAATLASSELGERAGAAGAGELRRVELRGTPAGPVAIVTGSRRRVRLDASTGRERPVDADEAKAIARRDLPGSPEVATVERVEEGAIPIEYRGKGVPAWRVALADGRGTAVYVDATSGDVVARRNDTWRTYDFLWSLHIMAYRDREDFRHALLIGAAGLAVVASLSGLVLWLLRARRFVRQLRGARRLA
jgi:uncharacterized iron-regulated membrane protein